MTNKKIRSQILNPRVQTLLNVFISSGKIPHALLFTGIDGVGKEFTAINFASAVNNIEDDPEKSERIKNKIEQLSEPYLKYIFPLPRAKNETESTGPTEKFSKDEMEIIQNELKMKTENPFYKIDLPKANTIKINSIRDIQKFISLDFSDVQYRVIIISNAHKMGEESQNALLKNLEEPPQNVIFILVTSHPEKLRETIISRCWKITFEPLADDNLIEILINYFDANKHDAELVVPFAHGAIDTAVNLINANIAGLKEKIISVLRFSFGKKYNSAFEELDQLIADENGINLEIVITMLVHWLSDLLRFQQQIKPKYFIDHEETFAKFNQKFPEITLDQITNKLDSLSSLLSRNINQKLLSANILFELSSVTGFRSS